MRKEDVLALNLGLSDEQAEKIAAFSAEEFKGYVTRERLKEKSEELESERKRVAERDAQIAELGKVKPEELQAEIEKLKAENKEKDEAHAAELARIALNSAVDTSLNAAGAKNLQAVKALVNLGDLKLSEDGTSVIGLDEQVKKLIEGEGTSFLFNVSDGSTEPPIRGFEPMPKGDKQAEGTSSFDPKTPISMLDGLDSIYD